MRRCHSTLLLPLLLLCAAHTARARDLPSYIKTCSETDPNPNECALKNGRAAIPYLVKGDPSIRLLPMDPQKITEMAVDNKGLKFTMSDMTVLGQAQTQLLDARAFPSERRLELDLLFPVLDMSFKYNVSGKVLVLPLDGTGTGTMKVGENTNKVLNENWQSLVEDVGPAMFASYRAVAQNLVDTLFDGVPYRKVILE